MSDSSACKLYVRREIWWERYPLDAEIERHALTRFARVPTGRLLQDSRNEFLAHYPRSMRLLLKASTRGSDRLTHNTRYLAASDWAVEYLIGAERRMLRPVERTRLLTAPVKGMPGCALE